MRQMIETALHAKTKPVYSGASSRPFWRRINRLPWSTRVRLYARGVTLQNKEERLLRDIARAEAGR